MDLRYCLVTTARLDGNSGYPSASVETCGRKRLLVTVVGVKVPHVASTGVWDGEEVA